MIQRERRVVVVERRVFTCVYWRLLAPAKESLVITIRLQTSKADRSLSEAARHWSGKLLALDLNEVVCSRPFDV